MMIVKLELGKSTFLGTDTRVCFITTATASLAIKSGQAASPTDMQEFLRDNDTWFGRSLSIVLSLDLVLSSGCIWAPEDEEHLKQNVSKLLTDATLWHQLGLEIKVSGEQGFTTSHSNDFHIRAELTEATSRSLNANTSFHVPDFTNLRCPKTVLDCQLQSIAVRWEFSAFQSDDLVPIHDSITSCNYRVIDHRIVCNAIDKGLRNVLGATLPRGGITRCIREQNTVKLMALAPSIFRDGFSEQVNRRVNFIEPVSRFLDKFSHGCQPTRNTEHTFSSHYETCSLKQSVGSSHHLWMTMINGLTRRRLAYQIPALWKSDAGRDTTRRVHQPPAINNLQQAEKLCDFRLLDVEKSLYNSQSSPEMSQISTQQLRAQAQYDTEFFLDDQELSMRIPQSGNPSANSKETTPSPNNAEEPLLIQASHDYDPRDMLWSEMQQLSEASFPVSDSNFEILQDIHHCMESVSSDPPNPYSPSTECNKTYVRAIEEVWHAEDLRTGLDRNQHEWSMDAAAAADIKRTHDALMASQNYWPSPEILLGQDLQDIAHEMLDCWHFKAEVDTMGFEPCLPTGDITFEHHILENETKSLASADRLLLE